MTSKTIITDVLKTTTTMVPTVTGITINLTMAEAEILYAIARNIGGSPIGSGREVTDRLEHLMHNAGVKKRYDLFTKQCPDMVFKDHTFRDHD